LNDNYTIYKALVIITRGRCLLGGIMYNLDSLIGVIPMLVFPVCWYDEKKYKVKN